MKAPPQYRSTVSIIPGGGMQFLDFAFNVDQMAKVRLYFREDRWQDANGGETVVPYRLFCLEEDPDTQQMVDRWSREPGDYHYEINGQKALPIFLDQWVPVPFLRLRADTWPQDGAPKFERGPSNWARVMVVRDEDPESPHSHRLVLAFDTLVEERPPQREPYFALSPEDVRENATFAFASHERDNGWFINAQWVDEWLKDIYEEYQLALRKGRPSRPEDRPYVLEHVANYLTFLQVLRVAGGSRSGRGLFPDIRVVDPAQHAPINVDFVLDLGNCRTCGILVETRPQSSTNLNDSYLLQIRDLSAPTRLYEEPFETRVEFSEANFGNPRLSARSGRASEAFVWPSVVRVGPESARLAQRSRGAEGNTGMSSPKRYLWDEATRVQQWRFNGVSLDGLREPPVTRGVFLQHINQEGTPLDRFGPPKDRAITASPYLRRQSDQVAFQALFTRSSLMMFLYSEIIMQALVTINSPAQRGSRDQSDIPRRLRRIIITVPTAMPVAEQKIYRRWARWAVGMVWRCLGWQDWLQDEPARRAPAGERLDFRQSPDIRCEWDEATCTQLVYLYNELTEKYQGEVHDLFGLLGKTRPEVDPQPSLRVASIDVGGGTTDLSITTFQAMGDQSSTARVRPRLEFREGFNVAGDDVLAALIENHLLRDLGRSLGQAGVAEPRKLLTKLFGRDVAGQSQRERNQRGQVVRQVFLPVCLNMLAAYEEVDLRRQNLAWSRRLGDFFGAEQPLNPEVTEYVEHAARAAGAREFSLAEVTVHFQASEFDQTVREVLGQVLADLCEMTHLHDCDLLLLTGRPSRWPAILSAVLAKLPLPADRVVAMHQYRVGGWYPYTDAMGQVSDPKTTVGVGAILCALAEGHLEGFSFDTLALKLRPTARYIGEMDLNGQIKRPKVWFEVDLDSAAEQEREHEVVFAGPLPIGYRQIDAERWTTTRYHLLTFASPQAVDNAKNRLPYRVKVRYRMVEVEDGEPGGQASDARLRDEGVMEILEVTDQFDHGLRREDLELRLQTLPYEDGYWLDTGVFQIIV